MSRFVLYKSSDEHSADCERFPFERIPRRVFLDTNIVDCLVKWDDCIFEQQLPAAGLDQTLQADIESLMHTFFVGSRANWDIVVSFKTIEELSQTSDPHMRKRLLGYGIDLVCYGTAGATVADDEAYAKDLARRLMRSPFLAGLPDLGDRELISHAIALRCDAFCTRDRRSLHRKRDSMRSLPLRILTPAEWWQHIKPWAGLWV